MGKIRSAAGNVHGEGLRPNATVGVAGPNLLILLLVSLAIQSKSSASAYL